MLPDVHVLNIHQNVQMQLYQSPMKKIMVHLQLFFLMYYFFREINFTKNFRENDFTEK